MSGFKCPQCGGSEYMTRLDNGLIMCARTENKMSCGIMASVLACNWSGPASACGLGEEVRRRTPMEIAYAWYRPDETWRCIQNASAIGGPCIPKDTASREFSDWLTDQYRLAMMKGIQLGRDGSEDSQPAQPASVDCDCRTNGDHRLCGEPEPKPAQPASGPQPERQPLATLDGQPAGFYKCHFIQFDSTVVLHWNGTGLSAPCDMHDRRYVVPMKDYRDFTRLYDAAEVEAVEQRAVKWERLHDHRTEQLKEAQQQLATVTAERDAIRQQLRDRQLADHPTASPESTDRKYASVEAMLRDIAPDFADEFVRYQDMRNQIANLKAVLRYVPGYDGYRDDPMAWLERRRAALEGNSERLC